MGCDCFHEPPDLVVFVHDPVFIGGCQHSRKHLSGPFSRTIVRSSGNGQIAGSFHQSVLLPDSRSRPGCMDSQSRAGRPVLIYTPVWALFAIVRYCSSTNFRRWHRGQYPGIPGDGLPHPAAGRRKNSIDLLVPSVGYNIPFNLFRGLPVLYIWLLGSIDPVRGFFISGVAPEVWT